MSKQDPFDRARETFAGLRSKIVDHAVKTGFADQSAEVMRARAAWYIEKVTKVALPVINQAISVADQEGMPAVEIEARVQGLVEYLAATVQDALRECGAALVLAAFPIKKDQ